MRHPKAPQRPASTSSTTKATKAARPSAAPSAQQHPPPDPYGVHDNILLVGEGDLSFALSLVEGVGCVSVLPTTLDGEGELRGKYPHIQPTLEALRTADCAAVHEVSATALSKSKVVRAKAPFDVIAFNFPHIGGKSTDVNRQVRANQALVVGYMREAMGVLKKDGKVLVTLFEGEPYTLWNIRDLGRSVGLAVRRSWRFESAQFEGYRHARTAGAEVSSTAWKGENRPARTYEFGFKAAVEEEQEQAMSQKKAAESSDEDSD
ncbi:hypothetical protein EJ06DRAFT_504186 [Trichodelitschia bisporula]|uniref:25S rRNA (uridine-N(3))-methyltransferase BMT5-like domain-containing protein n=1 Tax=Trichodelitschia bisporula TaxID=703511 RepID=A0A6G1I8V5_9PEZI|nr:hypothetical protein EJ06DRAFT_504186 [Trichodelitschia bisporula]